MCREESNYLSGCSKLHFRTFSVKLFLALHPLESETHSTTQVSQNFDLFAFVECFEFMI